MSNILEQAQAAADRQNWPLLVECLQQLTANGSQQPEKHILEQAVSLAIAALESGDFQDRWEIAKVLPNLGNGAIAPLIALLEDEDADTEPRWFAARILGKFVKPSYPKGNRPEVMQALVKLIENSDEELSQIAAETLGNFGTSAIESLTTLLQQADSRQFATAALAQIRRPEIIPPLLSVVTDSQVAVRACAIEALSSFHDSRIPSVLVGALKDPATAVRKEAVRALGVRAYLDAELDLVKLLKPLLWDIRLEVCQEAAIAIGRLKTDAAAAALFELLRSPATPLELQIETVRALGWSETAAGLEYLQKALIWRSADDLEGEGLTSNSAIPIVGEHRLIQNMNPAVCQEIVTVLGRVEKPELKAKAAEIAIDLLEGNHPAVQSSQIKQSLALALGQLGDIRAVDVLIQLLADADNSVRLHSLSALKRLGGGEVRQQLASLVDRPSLEPRLKQGIAIALQEWQEN
ncbi:MAG: HEAT repeat domain-containing protein [Microcoleus sp. PH2017_15_JOR_U_A]|uniref:HEAT repeat domain-containing protein n=1 Tax=unclassified Microcoleus TaxID=2642155 RepID=UPI001D481AA7|nr:MULTISPECIES: HEAT repeat domain-containing protein [unclassified Microcoleus]MCC3495633.1 HEAT repeat domain-containing protein [Microcoleus sp. PH2017_15_JOR_U_A]MCC3564103.1 HEAT repeat domain-containing protein [Microcoleus sp. PH2017_31_RDM_U_A]MCC3576540.1 HEAT repeat domain-containing protein [Microcoleus sp. PH2017_32_RDM_D_A]MCC3614414.1 HEAT repeat domain-containing protein [Microcoleus sp. PH2017_38_RDM_U_B]